MSREPGIWTEPFRVHSYEIDPQGRASVQTLCNYFQEAAGLHAQSYGVAIDDLLEHGLTWVLARLHVQVEAYPAWGETVEIETWPSGVQGLFATREVRFVRTEGDERTVIGRGTSAWLVVDVARKRPVRVPSLVRDLRLPDRPRALPSSFEKLPLPDDAGHECRFRVRHSDLDLNQHVNNVRYAEWAVESVPADVLTGARLCELELHFLAETTLGDMVLASAHTEANGPAPAFLHRLVREADGRTVAMARTRWTTDGENGE